MFVNFFDIFCVFAAQTFPCKHGTVLEESTRRRNTHRSLLQGEREKEQKSTQVALFLTAGVFIPSMRVVHSSPTNRAAGGGVGPKDGVLTFIEQSGLPVPAGRTRVTRLE